MPLAALAHLLPPEVTRPSGPEGELDRALLFYRARAALEQGEEGRRWVVMVDDIDHLDDLSRALLVSLVHARTAFIVCTIRATGHNDDEVRTLVNDSHLRRLEPTPLAPDTVEALLHRVLRCADRGGQPRAARRRGDRQPGSAAPARRVGA